MNKLKYNFIGLGLVGMMVWIMGINIAFAKDADVVDLIDIKVTQEKDKIRVILSTDLAIKEYDSFTLSKPPSIVVDLPDTHCVPRDMSVSVSGINRIQSVQEENKTKVVINLVKLTPYYTRKTQEGIELIIDNPYYNYGLTDIQIKEAKDQLKVYISADAAPQYKYFDLSNPPRIIVDFLNADIKIGKIEKEKGIVKKITAVQRQTDPVKVGRIEIELKEAQSYEVISERNTVIIDLSKEEIKEKEVEAIAEVKEIVPSEIKEEASTTKKVAITSKKSISKVKPQKKYVTKKMITRKRLPRIKEEKQQMPISVVFEPLKMPTSIEGEKKISLDLKDADLLDVLRLISHKVNINIIPSPNVKGMITLRVDDLPWRTVLKMVLANQGYTFIEEEDVIKVDTEGALIGDVITKIITLNYANASTIVTSLQSVITKGVGRIDVDNRTNSLIITDIPKVMPRVEQLIKQLDTMTPQVMIEAKIVEVVLDESNQLGIEWSLVGNSVGIGSTFAGGAPGGFLPSAEAGADSTMNGALVGSQMFMGDGAGLVLGKVINGKALNFALSALISENKANVLSAPRIRTVNNQQASIMVGEQVPYTPLKSSSGGQVQTSVSFIPVGIKLSVTPQINIDKFILLNIKPEVSSLKGFSQDNQPIISTKEASCQVIAKDGETIVIGGIMDDQGTEKISKIPFLGDLPFLAPLFKHKTSEKRKKELLIFVTPTIEKY